MPQGGPIDSLHPIFIKSNPPVGINNFKLGNRKQITMLFDEYVQLKDLATEFYMTPITDKKPLVKVKGKSVVVEFKDSVIQENTTYQLNFGNAIVDNNESNPVYQFRYFFATGNEMDSMEISAVCLDAITIQPVPMVYLFFYKNVTDSILQKQKPDWLARGSMRGLVYATNLKPIDYTIYAVEDKNMNYMYDKGDEKIGFVDFNINPKDELPVLFKADTIKKNSYVHPQFSFKMFLEEKDARQYLVEVVRPEPQKIIFYFNAPNPEITFLDFEGYNFDSLVFHRTKTKDTITVWLPYTEKLPDTVWSKISYMKSDSLNNLVLQEDTLILAYDEKVEKEKKKDKRRKAKKGLLDELESDSTAMDSLLNAQMMDSINALPEPDRERALQKIADKEKYDLKRKAKIEKLKAKIRKIDFKDSIKAGKKRIRDSILIAFEKKLRGIASLEDGNKNIKADTTALKDSIVGDTVLKDSSYFENMRLDSINMADSIRIADSLALANPELEVDEDKTIKMHTLFKNEVRPKSELGIYFENPLVVLDTAKITFREAITDSTFQQMTFTIKTSDVDYRYYRLVPIPDMQPEKKYQLIFEKGAFFDYTHALSDSMGYALALLDPEQFAVLNIIVEDQEGPYVIELVDKDGNVSSKIEKSQIGDNKFEYIDPKFYAFRFIEDLDSNGEFTSGDVKTKRQPERVYYYEEGEDKGFRLRANWDVEYTVNLKEIFADLSAQRVKRPEETDTSYIEALTLFNVIPDPQAYKDSMARIDSLLELGIDPLVIYKMEDKLAKKKAKEKKKSDKIDEKRAKQEAKERKRQEAVLRKESENGEV